MDEKVATLMDTPAREGGFFYHTVDDRPADGRVSLVAGAAAAGTREWRRDAVARRFPTA